MGIYAKPENQAEKAIKAMGKAGKVPSIGSGNSYKPSLRMFARFAKDRLRTNLKEATPNQVRAWLDKRAREVSQKTLDRDRQALNKWNEYRGYKDQIEKSEAKSRLDNSNGLANQPRAYTNEQLDRIQNRMVDYHAVAIQVGREAGLREHETATIARPHEQPAHDRPWREDRFRPDQTEKYTVEGKGGLIREIRLTPETAAKLEQFRRPEPTTVVDRGIRYESRYAIGYGQALGKSFSHHSNKELGWSAGHHGIRHTYCQDRITELQKDDGYTYNEAKLVVSQELGHFSTSNTNDYLR